MYSYVCCWPTWRDVQTCRLADLLTLLLTYCLRFLTLEQWLQQHGIELLLLLSRISYDLPRPNNYKVEHMNDNIIPNSGNYSHFVPLAHLFSACACMSWESWVLSYSSLGHNNALSPVLFISWSQQCTVKILTIKIWCLREFFRAFIFLSFFFSALTVAFSF